MVPPRARGFGLCLLVAGLIALSFSASARADTVTDWNAHAVNALVGTAGQSPTVSTVHLAMVHGAVYDAVNSIDERYEPYLVRRSRARLVLAGRRGGHRRLSRPAGARPGAAAHAGPALRGVARRDPGRRRPSRAASARVRSPRRRCWPPAPATAVAAPTASRRRPRRRTRGEGQWRPVLPAFGNDPAAWIKDVRPFLIRDPARYAKRRPVSAHEQALRARVQRGQGDRRR